MRYQDDYKAAYLAAITGAASALGMVDQREDRGYYFDTTVE